MAEQTGPAIVALEAVQGALMARRAGAADSDQVLAEIASGAHAATVRGIERLSSIAREIDNALRGPGRYAADNSLAAREFQKFLIAKNREILAVVAEANRIDAVGGARLKSLTYPG